MFIANNKRSKGKLNKNEFFYYIQLYVSQIIKYNSFTFIYEDNLYLIDDDGPFLAFAVTSDNRTILPVPLTTQRDEICFDIIKCFLLMIKDMREMLPYVISDVVKDTEKILNKIKKVNVYQENHKKYNLRRLTKEMKKI